MGPVLVFGHRNPDNDSVCSAVGYALLKNATDPGRRYEAARLGDAPAETAWVFERFGLTLPDAIDHVRVRVRDVMVDDVASVGADDLLLDVGRLMRERDVRSIPVVDGAGRPVGLVTSMTLADRYVAELEPDSFDGHPIEIDHLARTLDAKVYTGDPSAELTGRVRTGAMEPETMRGRIDPGDIVIMGDRRRSQPIAIEAGAACLVVAGGFAPSEEAVGLARERGVAVLATEHDTYAATRLVSLAHTASEVAEDDLLLVSPDALLSEVAEDVLTAHSRAALVVDGGGRLVGLVTRSTLARAGKREVVLVDHNEAAQSAPGIEEASVVEIVDHHRVGDVQTAGPVLFLNVPVGATATIVARRFDELGVEMPPAVAGILLAAVLTDTVILKSPTTTDLDRATAALLASRCGEEVEPFGLALFRARAAGTPLSPESVVGTDLKRYQAGELACGIAQHESIDADAVLEREPEIRAAMEALATREGLDLVVLMITDIMREGSYLLAAGKVRVAERAFDGPVGERAVWLPGVMSRKKQVAARVVDAAG